MAALSSPRPANFDAFGVSTAISGDTLVVGDPNDSEPGFASGAVYVFRRANEGPQGWRWTAKLHAPASAVGGKFGDVVAIDGDVLVVGDYLDSSLGIEEAGVSYVFERTGPDSEAWTQTARLSASDPFRAALFGVSVAISGEMIAVGAPLALSGDQRTGAIYVFGKADVTEGKAWRQVQKVLPSPTSGIVQFGNLLALSRDRMAVGLPLDSTGGVLGGAVQVYQRMGATWRHDATLMAPDGSWNDFLGAVAIAGDQIIAGAPGDDDQGTVSGSAYVFTRHDQGWEFTQKLLSVPGEAGAAFGGRLAADRDLLIVTAPQSDAQAANAGVAYAFRRLANGTWVQSGALQPSGLQPQDIMFAPAVSDGIAVLGILTFPVGGTVHVFDTRLERSLTTYCEPSDTGDPDCVPVLEAVGNATASGTSEFRLRAGPVPSGQLGFFAYMHAPSGLPVGNSAWTCLPGPALGRSQLLLSGGTYGVCDGLFELDWNELLASNAGQDPALAEPGTHVYGQFVHFQFGSAGRVQLSEAVAFVTCP